MCALYTLHTTYAEFLDSLSLPLKSAKHFESIDQRFLPHQPAPVVRATNNQFELEWMNFSLIPSWSKDRRPKFATHNARLESLTEKPTWKRPLLKNHALIPISEFIEPIYEGEQAGYMVGFSQPENKTIWAAGLWDEWIDPSTGEIIPSFTIITHEPGDFVREIGHDREPLFITQDSFSTWLGPETKNATEWVKFLKQAHQEPPLKIRPDRKLKSKLKTSN